jgi:hypothetical protein
MAGDRLYYAEFRVDTTLTDRNSVPSFRLRLNETGYMASQYTQVASNFFGDEGAQNVPSAGSPRIYRVFFPVNAAIGNRLFGSFDLLTTAADNDATSGSLFLLDMTIYEAQLQ